MVTYASVFGPNVAAFQKLYANEVVDESAAALATIFSGAKEAGFITDQFTPAGPSGRLNVSSTGVEGGANPAAAETI